MLTLFSPSSLSPISISLSLGFLAQGFLYHLALFGFLCNLSKILTMFPQLLTVFYYSCCKNCYHSLVFDIFHITINLWNIFCNILKIYNVLSVFKPQRELQRNGKETARKLQRNRKGRAKALTKSLIIFSIIPFELFLLLFHFLSLIFFNQSDNSFLRELLSYI